MPESVMNLRTATYMQKRNVKTVLQNSIAAEAARQILTTSTEALTMPMTSGVNCKGSVLNVRL